MLKLGYTLASEEHRPNDLVRFARQAEDCGFDFGFISDHFHPWIDNQGQSPFVWSVLGALAHSTAKLNLITGVTCPTFRIHPVIIAQAAATVAAMMPGRFALGLGSGENLNEHITGARWPSSEERMERLEEAIAIIRMMWQGGVQSHRGKYYQVDTARIYTLPDQLPPLMIAASGKRAAGLAGRTGDGLVSTSPDADLIKEFQSEGGKRKPCYGQLTMCWAEDEHSARRTALQQWPNSALPGVIFTELPLPAHFEQLTKLLDESEVAESVICGPALEPYLDKLRKYAEAGFDHVTLHQVGPNQEGFFQWCSKELFPRLRSERLIE
ncbi:MAG TPA: TIGR03557 family F420-dependent LLM class oxidoreductase [Terriglobales bacterium]|nr:TIGR03557 family F420-dependent LLM class oxidoreductase [Terriglobales bacterium]